MSASCVLLGACGSDTPDVKSPYNSAGSAAAPVAPLAQDAPAKNGPDKQRERLEAANGHFLKNNYTPKGKQDRYGHAEAIVDAPLADVRKAILDFGDYKSLAPDKFKTVRMVAKENGTVDMYFLVPVLKGLATIWYVTRFPDHTVPDGNGVEVLDGKFVKGSIEDMELELTIRSIAPRETILTCDLLIVPTLPAPQSALDETFRDAAGDAVAALKKKVETSPDATQAMPPADMPQPSPQMTQPPAATAPAQ
ncbi:MAG: hypothetical protein ABI183_12065 [Polyangiaceae bacterium]